MNELEFTPAIRAAILTDVATVAGLLPQLDTDLPGIIQAMMVLGWMPMTQDVDVVRRIILNSVAIFDAHAKYWDDPTLGEPPSDPAYAAAVAKALYVPEPVPEPTPGE
jgi:hypothetical protein